MNIKFIIEADSDSDNYIELYTAQVDMEDGTSFTVNASEEDLTYDRFRADIFEDLFQSIAEATGVPVTIEEDDWASVDIDEVEDLDDLTVEDYLAGIEADGC